MFCLYKNLYFLFNNFLKFNHVNSYYYNIYNFKKLNDFALNQNILCKNSLNFYLKNHEKYFYRVNKLNIFYVKTLNKTLNKLFFNNKNALVLDSNYKLITPLYQKIFGLKNLYLNKNFFFIEKNNLTRPNWIYLFLKRVKNFNINLIMILDLYFFKNHISFLKKFNLPIASLVPINLNVQNIDYAIFINIKMLDLSKLYFLNFLTNLYFKNCSFFLGKFKKLFFFKYNLFLKSIN